jgi:hypothetical protein
MLARADEAVGRADQLFARMAGDVAEAVVGVDDDAARIGDADDGVLVKREFLVLEVAFARIDVQALTVGLHERKAYAEPG